MIAWWTSPWSVTLAGAVVLLLTLDWIVPPMRGALTLLLWRDALPTPSRRACLRELRTMELWAWWMRMREAYRDLEVWVRKDGRAVYSGPRRQDGSILRPAMHPAYDGKESELLYLDKFDRIRVAYHYAGNVGGYSDRKLDRMIKEGDTIC